MDNRDALKARFLSNKRTLLSVPGQLKTDAYYTVDDATVGVIELTANLGRYVSSLTTSQFGGTGQVIVPNQDILGNTYLHLRLPKSVDAGTSTAAKWSAPMGWGWHAIKNISYLWGASNVSQISITGKSLWAIALAQCETEEKRAKLCYLGGGCIPAPSGSSISPDLEDVEGIEYDCYLPLSLPWSVMCHEGKIGYDTGLLNSPITIQIQFADRSEFICQRLVGSSGTLTTLPTQFEVAEIVLRQQMFSNRSQSLKYEMDESNGIYNYPFKHYASFNKDFSCVPGTSTKVQLTNFINADLIGMIVFVVKKSNLQGGALASDTDASFKFNPLDLDMISDVRLLFNGQVLYNSPGKLYLLQNCANLSGAGGYYAVDTSIKNGTEGNQLSLGYKPIVRDMVFIDFSRRHTPCFEEHYENTFRIAQQTLDLEFKTTSDGSAAEQQYSLFATYIYNAVNATQHGSSNLYFD